MQADALFFWILAPLLVVSAFAVIVAKNPVHSVLFLILSFVCAAGLFLLMGAEFLAMILVVVYVGAVAVLFLFVVMLLDVDFARLRQGFVEYLPQGLLIALVVAIELIYVVSGLGPSQRAAPAAAPGCFRRRRRPARRRRRRQKSCRPGDGRIAFPALSSVSSASCPSFLEHGMIFPRSRKPRGTSVPSRQNS